jgi:hypothetical protein
MFLHGVNDPCTHSIQIGSLAPITLVCSEEALKIAKEANGAFENGLLLLQLNQKIEAMRKKTQDIRQGNINEYIRVTNSIAQAQRHKSALEHDIRQVALHQFDSLLRM